MKKVLFSAVILLLWSTLAMAATTADLVSVVDESGSMSTEHAWLSGMITNLDTNLIAKSVTGNQYGLTGFGSGSSTVAHSYSSIAPHTHPVGGGDFGTAANFGTATSGLVISGGTEDGWRALNYAMTSYSYRSGAAKNLLLVTDEDRDNTDSSTYAGTLAALQAGNFLLNAVVNATYTIAGAGTILGIDSKGNAYVADGLGGYTKISSAGVVINDFGTTTQEDYITMALASGGAAWDLNQLRAGGLLAASFTKAFVDIKVQEIIVQPTPEPLSFLLVGLGLFGLGILRRRD